MQLRSTTRGVTTAPRARRPILRRDYRHGLRRYTMHNESMAYYDAHPDEWAALLKIVDRLQQEYGPPPPLPRYTKLTLRGEVFRTAKGGGGLVRASEHGRGNRMRIRTHQLGATRELIRRRPIVRRDFRHGLRKFSMRNETMAYFEAHPEEWARLLAECEANERVYGPPPPTPPHTRLTLRGEILNVRNRR